jgi:hypothetical protein
VRSVELSFLEMAELTDHFLKCSRPFKATAVVIINIDVAVYIDGIAG